MLFYTYTRLNRRGKKEPSERYCHRFKGSVGVISSDPPLVECRVQFTIVPFNILTDQRCRTYYFNQKTLFFASCFISNKY